MDPCWSLSRLVRFDLPKPHHHKSNFGVHCDLISRSYDYERIWVILDTTDTLPTESFQCPKPYIDTSFIKVFNDLSLITKLLQTETIV